MGSNAIYGFSKNKSLTISKMLSILLKRTQKLCNRTQEIMHVPGW